MPCSRRPAGSNWIRKRILQTVTQQDIDGKSPSPEIYGNESLNIPSVRTDFAYIVITGSIVYNAKIDPSTALLKETILPHLLLQLVVSDKNKDAQWAKDIAAAYKSPEFAEYMKKNNTGLWFDPEQKRNKEKMKEAVAQAMASFLGKGAFL